MRDDNPTQVGLFAMLFFDLILAESATTSQKCHTESIKQSNLSTAPSDMLPIILKLF